MITFSDVIGGIAGALTSINQSVMAMSFGFAMMPSLLAYIVGIVGCLVFHSAVPISFQAETLIMAGTLGRNRRERISIVMFAGILMTLIGAFGLLSTLTGFAGENLVCAMMAGVGIVLCKVALDMTKNCWLIGSLSILICSIIYLFTQNIGYASLAAIVITMIVGKICKIENITKIEVEDKFELQKLMINTKIILGTLSVMCLTIGGNIATSGITQGISGIAANPNQVSIYSGLADALSSLFGGSPISVVISASAAAPHPVTSAVILMVIMAIVLATGVLPKLIRLIPPASVAGVLFVLGAFLTLPENLRIAFTDATPSSALASSVTLAVTAISDPFIGLFAGIIIRTAATMLGM